MGQHPAVSRLGARVWAVLAATLLLAAPGCVTTATSLFRPLGFPSDDAPVSHVMAIWYNYVHTVPDCVNHATPLPGLVGHVYLVSANNRFQQARGKIVADVFDASNPNPGAEPAWLYRTELDPASLAQLKSKDPYYGLECYTVFLPWPADKAVPPKVRVNLGYLADNRLPVYAEPSFITFHRDKPHHSVEVHSRREIIDPAFAANLSASGKQPDSPPQASQTKVTYGPSGGGNFYRQGTPPQPQMQQTPGPLQQGQPQQGQPQQGQPQMQQMQLQMEQIQQQLQQQMLQMQRMQPQNLGR